MAKLHPIKGPKCFSRSGWWQTLCGRDAANQGFGWSDRKTEVGCGDCLKMIKQNKHYRIFRPDEQVMFNSRKVS